MPTILAIDCSSEIGSVALHHLATSASLTCELARQHARETLPMIQRLLEQAQISVQQLDAIAITRGPGSFTGLRIGTAVAQGLAFAHNLPIIPVSSLATMAVQAVSSDESNHPQVHIEVALFARDGEVYQASYRLEDGVTLVGAERVSTVGQLAEYIKSLQGPWVAVGNGWQDETLQRCAEKAVRFLPQIRTHATPLLSLALKEYAEGNTVAAEDAQPVYLKEQEYRQA